MIQGIVFICFIFCEVVIAYDCRPRNRDCYMKANRYGGMERFVTKCGQW